MFTIRLLPPLLACASAFAQKPDTGNPVLATVNGIEIHQNDLNVQGQLLQLERQKYDIVLHELRNAISLKVLDLAAKAKGMERDAFLDAESSQIDEPTEAGLRGFYLAQLARYKEDSFESVRDEVIKDFKDAERQALRLALVQRLLAADDIRILMQPARLNVDSRNAPRRGPADSPVTIVEFSDFQCPYCKLAETTLKAVAAKYGDKVAFVFKDFPLTNAHPQAQSAAEAAHCAADQNKFWSYHDLLFAASPDFNRDAFLRLAGQAGLDAAAFARCLDSGASKAQITANEEQGKALGVDSTPTFFINGAALTGAAAIEEFQDLIDAALVEK